MNVKQVKEQWDLPSLMDHMGCEVDQKKSKGHQLWYSSPFRTESDSSFKIDTSKNVWYDFGLAESKNGGDLIYFAQTYLRLQGKPNSISSVLQWFISLSGAVPPKTQKTPPEHLKSSEKDAFNLISVKPLFSKALFDYIESRNIDRELATEFLKQVYFQHIETGRKIYGVGMLNQSGGYDVRNPLDFKGCVGSKAISYIKGKSSEPVVDVFEGTFDFLSRLTIQKSTGRLVPEFDSIVMHTNNMFEQAADLIREKGYKHIHLWLDNDQGGDKGIAAIENCLENLPEITFIDERQKYEGFKDLNDWCLSI